MKAWSHLEVESPDLLVEAMPSAPEYLSVDTMKNLEDWKAFQACRMNPGFGTRLKYKVNNLSAPIKI